MILSSSLKVTDWAGQIGNKTHPTRSEIGTVPIDVIKNMHGEAGERPGEHRFYQGDKWDEFKNDIKTNGMKNPIFITVDPGGRPKINEGNHRRDAAVELGMKHVPVEIRYFGHAERTGGTVMERHNMMNPRIAGNMDSGPLETHLESEHGNTSMHELRERYEGERDRRDGMGIPDYPEWLHAHHDMRHDWGDSALPHEH